VSHETNSLPGNKIYVARLKKFSLQKKLLSLDRWRKIQQVGLAKEYKEKDSLTGKWIRHIFGLIFLKLEQVGDTFVFDFICMINGY
jgi:hypothetical protein